MKNFLTTGLLISALALVGFGTLAHAKQSSNFSNGNLVNEVLETTTGTNGYNLVDALKDDSVVSQTKKCLLAGMLIQAGSTEEGSSSETHNALTSEQQELLKKTVRLCNKN
ncbi:MAG: hypothetical protein ACXVCP_11525 [Bdellovibrio sp.]